MPDFSQEFLKKTKDVWQKRASAPITDDDAREIAQNVTALFKFLMDLEKKYSQPTSDDSNGKSPHI